MFGMYDPRPEQRRREAELRAEQNTADTEWLANLKARHPLNSKCKVECFDPDDNLPFCWCSRMQERGDMDIPSKPLSELTPPPRRDLSLWRRASHALIRMTIAFFVAILALGPHAPPWIVMIFWIGVACYLEIVSLRITITRR